jgi:valyl-tRNA synthetase
MIMSGLEFTGQVPFDTVYLHGLIRDDHSRKMSKSYGNVIDPLGLMDDLGTDALRFTLLVGSTPGNDMNLSVKKVEANRNFANKIWNVGRFIISSISQSPTAPIDEHQWTLADSWIWARLQSLIRDVERLFQNYQYGEAGRQIYDFFWSDFADWYVEIAKLQLAEGGDRAFYTTATLVRILDLSLRLLHPFTPFITEELWGHLKRASQEHSDNLSPHGGWSEALIIAQFPEPRPEESWEASRQTTFGLIQDIVRAVRNIRAEKNVRPGQLIPATIVSADQTIIIREQAKTIASLAQIDYKQLTIIDSLPGIPQGHVPLVVGSSDIYLPIAHLVDTEEERARLEKDMAEIQSQIQRLEALLAGPFAQKAPAAVVNKEREKLETYRQTAEKVRSQLNELEG